MAWLHPAICFLDAQNSRLDVQVSQQCDSRAVRSCLFALSVSLLGPSVLLLVRLFLPCCEVLRNKRRCEACVFVTGSCESRQQHCNELFGGSMLVALHCQLLVLHAYIVFWRSHPIPCMPEVLQYHDTIFDQKWGIAQLAVQIQARYARAKHPRTMAIPRCWDFLQQIFECHE